MSLGKRLAEARKAFGLSQVAFAERCGISDSAQLHFEKEKSLPGSAYLLELAKLGIDVNFVLLGMPGAMTPEEAVLLNAFRAADEKTRKTLLAHALVGQSALSAPAQSVGGDNHGQLVSGDVKARDQTFNVGGGKKKR